jgi:hypothetical protein
MTQVILTLPDELAQQAQAAGLLDDQAVEAMLREAVRKQRVDRLFSTMEKLSTLPPVLTESEIAAEIAQARAERRRRNANRR